MSLSMDDACFVTDGMPNAMLTAPPGTHSVLQQSGGRDLDESAADAV